MSSCQMHVKDAQKRQIERSVVVSKRAIIPALAVFLFWRRSDHTVARRLLVVAVAICVTSGLWGAFSHLRLAPDVGPRLWIVFAAG